MTTEEMRELDAWIAENVYRAHIYTSGRGSVCAMFNANTENEFDRIIDSKHPWDSTTFNPTNDSKDAMDVLKKCAEKCSEKTARSITISSWMEKSGEWAVGSYEPSVLKKAETLELAICLLAKQLFTK